MKLSVLKEFLKVLKKDYKEVHQIEIKGENLYFKIKGKIRYMSYRSSCNKVLSYEEKC